MNYNTQQVFWGVFSSNHAEQHLPYVDLCEKILPLSVCDCNRTRKANRRLTFVVADFPPVGIVKLS